MLVGLTYNLKPPSAAEGYGYPCDEYAEWDHAQTIHAIRSALEKRHEVVLFNAQGQVHQQLLKTRPDFVFNIAEGTCGAHREAEIPLLLESLGIPYTGSTPETLSLCLNKARTKRSIQTKGIPTPRFTHCEPDRHSDWTFFPAIVKPNWEGSSKGILDSSVVRNRQELLREVERIWHNYDQPALVEEFLEGPEFTTALLGNGDEVEVLPIIHIDLDCLPPTAKRIYSYQAKWEWDKPENPLPILRCPAKIPRTLSDEIRALALQTFKALECRDWCRIDFRTDARGKVHVLEVNPLPGVLPDPRENSCFPLAARTVGISYDDLILKVLDIACRRVENNHASDHRVSQEKTCLLGEI